MNTWTNWHRPHLARTTSRGRTECDRAPAMRERFCAMKFSRGVYAARAGHASAVPRPTGRGYPRRPVPSGPVWPPSGLIRPHLVSSGLIRSPPAPPGSTRLHPIPPGSLRSYPIPPAPSGPTPVPSGPIRSHPTPSGPIQSHPVTSSSTRLHPVLSNPLRLPPAPSDPATV